jgi:hypothetical protein
MTSTINIETTEQLTDLLVDLEQHQPGFLAFLDAIDAYKNQADLARRLEGVVKEPWLTAWLMRGFEVGKCHSVDLDAVGPDGIVWREWIAQELRKGLREYVYHAGDPGYAGPIHRIIDSSYSARTWLVLHPMVLCVDYGCRACTHWNVGPGSIQHTFLKWEPQFVQLQRPVHRLH